MTERHRNIEDQYDQDMRFGADQYADILAMLNSKGYSAKFTQTGGMCAAIELHLHDGAHTALVTDDDAPLSWERSEHRGWGLGVYDVVDTSEPIWYKTTPDSSPAALLALLDSLSID